MEKQLETILIFCDGASKGNPGRGGWGAIVATDSSIVELGGQSEHTTNNKMELKAALEALTYADNLTITSCTIYTDSSYVINGITKWVSGWKKNGWKTKEKKDVLNRELWVALDNAVEKIKGEIDWHYVGGHVGVAGNERVDAIASSFAENKKIELYNGSRNKYLIEISNLGRDESLHKDKSALKARSKAKAYSYISRVDGKVMVHKTWAECEARVNGKSAKYKKSLSKEDEANIIAEFSAK